MDNRIIQNLKSREITNEEIELISRSEAHSMFEDFPYNHAEESFYENNIKMFKEDSNCLVYDLKNGERYVVQIIITKGERYFNEYSEETVSYDKTIAEFYILNDGTINYDASDWDILTDKLGGRRLITEKTLVVPDYSNSITLK